jgi:hypothetical protein
MTRAEIGLSVVGLVSATYNIYLHWRLGGKQTVDNQTKDSITAGTDKIVETSNKLLEKMEQMLMQESLRTKVEKDHRESCEKQLAEHQKQINLLTKEIEKLKRA